jgi:hypothetical protein
MIFSVSGGQYTSNTCGSSGGGTLPTCTQFFYTGVKQAVDCAGTLKCYAQVQLTEGGTSQWLFSHVCGQGSSVAGEVNNADCGGGAWGLAALLGMAVHLAVACSH